jgi:hypothetical protein
MMKTKVRVILRERFGLKQEDRCVEILHNSYEDLVFEIKKIHSNGGDLMLLTEDCSGFFTDALYLKLKDDASITAVFHTRSIETNVHVVKRTVFGVEQSPADIKVSHSTFGELEIKINAFHSSGRNLRMIINDGKPSPNDAKFEELNFESYETFRDTYDIIAIFDSMEIQSNVHILGKVEEGKYFLIKEKKVSHYDFQGLKESIKTEIDHFPSSRVDVFQEKNGDHFHVDVGSYRNMDGSQPIIVHLDFGMGITRIPRVLSSSFFDTASSFQQRVLQFKATPRGPSCDRPRRTAA